MLQLFSRDRKERVQLSHLAQKIAEVLNIDHILIDINIEEDMAIPGHVDLHDDDDPIEISIKEDLPYMEKVVTIAHEMIHVWQHNNGFSLSEDVAYTFETDLAKMVLNNEA